MKTVLPLVLVLSENNCNDEENDKKIIRMPVPQGIQLLVLK